MKDSEVSSGALAQPTASPCAARSAAGVLLDTDLAALVKWNREQADNASYTRRKRRDHRLSAEAIEELLQERFKLLRAALDAAGQRCAVSVAPQLEELDRMARAIVNEMSRCYSLTDLTVAQFRERVALAAFGALPDRFRPAETKQADGPDSARYDNPNSSTGSVP